MVRIFLSPDGDPLWIQRALGPSDPPLDAATRETLEEAERLLSEAPPAAQKTAKWEVLRCAVLVAQRSADALDEAIARLAAVLEGDSDSIPALNLLSTAFRVSGQGAKARNSLKRLLKLPGAGPGEHAEECVDAWLQLAAISDESGKPDQAAEAVQRALALDSSAGRAWEYLGGLAEKDLRYADAAENYEKAWACEGEASAPVGFKLAFNYLKAGAFCSCLFFFCQQRGPLPPFGRTARARTLTTAHTSQLYTEIVTGRATAAIDVGKKVLAAYPDYPRIREDV